MRRIRTALVVIAMNNLFLTLGFRLWQSIFNNFAVEELGVRADQIGLIQAVREVPGLMGFLVGVLVLFLVEMRIAGLSVVLMGVGIFLTAAARDMSGLIGATLVMSVGFHFFNSSNSSAVLLAVGPDEAPKVLGRLNSLGALAAVIGTLFIFATLDVWGYRTLFRVAGAVVVIGGLALLPFGRQPMQARRTRHRTPLRRRYCLYYALQFLMGSRRHIFTTFAIFLLVREYRVTPQTITLLFLVNSLIGTYFHQAFGKIVARFGEQRVLTVNFVLLMGVFLGYAVVPMLSALETPAFLVPRLSVGSWVLFPAFPATPGLLVLLGLFVADHILFGFSIALQSYFQKIAVGPEEITPNISLGQTINHIAAVVVPVVGGLVWEAAGAQYTFLAGVVIALVSLGLTLRMRVPQRERIAALAVGR
ncbi:MAG TPA: MFS transporter [Chloroflexi bacterium]|nr:MFS transporter [Chloroflexota bacterium]